MTLRGPFRARGIDDRARVRRVAWLLAALLLAALFLAGCRTAPSPLAQRLDALLTQYERDGFSGTVLVAKQGQVVLHEGYGFADRARGVRNEPDTLFEIASITKTFTAAAILHLESRGALRTSDLLSQHLGAFPPPKSAATIHHLATHTAGLVPDGAELAYGDDRERFIESVKNVPAESAPGERYRYTNAGFSMLAATVEKASGRTFEEYVREHLLAAAGMRDTYFRGSVPASAMPRIALGHSADGKVSTPPPYRWGTRGSGGMITTVAELHRWHRALLAGRVLPKEQLAKMFHPWPEEGYGWHVEQPAGGPRRIHKGGGMPEYASQLIYYPDEDVLVIWVCNDLRTRWRQTLNRGIAEIVVGQPGRAS